PERGRENTKGTVGAHTRVDQLRLSLYRDHGNRRIRLPRNLPECVRELSSTECGSQDEAHAPSGAAACIVRPEDGRATRLPQRIVPAILNHTDDPIASGRVGAGSKLFAE